MAVGSPYGSLGPSPATVARVNAARPTIRPAPAIVPVRQAAPAVVRPAAPAPLTPLQQATRQAGAIIDPQEAAQTAYANQQNTAIQQFALALMGRLQPMATQVGSYWDRSIGQTGALANQAATFLQQANPTPQVQGLLSSINAPPEQQAQIAGQLGQNYGGSAAVLNFLGGAVPGTEMATEKAAAQTQAAQYPLLAALRGQQALGAALTDQASKQAALETQRATLTQSALKDIQTAQATAGYRAATLKQQQINEIDRVTTARISALIREGINPQTGRLTPLAQQAADRISNQANEALARLGETQRHNYVMEGLAGQRIAAANATVPVFRRNPDGTVTRTGTVPKGSKIFGAGAGAGATTTGFPKATAAEVTKAAAYVNSFVGAGGGVGQWTDVQGRPVNIKQWINNFNQGKAAKNQATPGMLNLLQTEAANGDAKAAAGLKKLGLSSTRPQVTDIYRQVLRDTPTLTRYQAFQLVAKAFPAWGKTYGPKWFPNQGKGSAAQAAAATNPTVARQTALQIAGNEYGWGSPAEQQALATLGNNESGWSYTARNPHSGALGIGQELGHAVPPDYATNPVTQIRWMLDYIKSNYGSPSRALAFWYSKKPPNLPQGNWY
jgi:hypothetical protein